MVKKDKTINIKVPAGVESGNYMTVEGQGNENMMGNPGDLLVVFEEKTHQYFVRDSENIFIEINYKFSSSPIKIKLLDIDSVEDQLSDKEITGFKIMYILSLGQKFEGRKVIL